MQNDPSWSVMHNLDHQSWPWKIHKVLENVKVSCPKQLRLARKSTQIAFIKTHFFWNSDRRALCVPSIHFGNEFQPQKTLNFRGQSSIVFPTSEFTWAHFLADLQPIGNARLLVMMMKTIRPSKSHFRREGIEKLIGRRWWSLNNNPFGRRGKLVTVDLSMAWN